MSKRWGSLNKMHTIKGNYGEIHEIDFWLAIEICVNALVLWSAFAIDQSGSVQPTHSHISSNQPHLFKIDKKWDKIVTFVFSMA